MFLNVINDDAYNTAKKFYESLAFVERKKFDYCAALTIDSIVKLEPGLKYAGNENQKLNIYISSDDAGGKGDVRDVVFERSNPRWEIGFSAKNNNDAVKHSMKTAMVETIDYTHNIINYDGKSFPFTIVIENDGDDNQGIEHIVSVHNLSSELFNNNSNYISDKAQWLDELITYFVEKEEDLKRSNDELLKEIYG